VVRVVAGGVRATAGVLGRAPAAELFRERVRARAAGLGRVAAQVEEAADLLGAHARAVAVQLARAEDTAGDLTGVVRQVWRG